MLNCKYKTQYVCFAISWPELTEYITKANLSARVCLHLLRKLFPEY